MSNFVHTPGCLQAGCFESPLMNVGSHDLHNCVAPFVDCNVSVGLKRATAFKPYEFFRALKKLPDVPKLVQMGKSALVLLRKETGSTYSDVR